MLPLQLALKARAQFHLFFTLSVVKIDAIQKRHSGLKQIWGLVSETVRKPAEEKYRGLHRYFSVYKRT